MKKLDVQVKVGYYGNVNIGVIRTNGDMVTILPMNIQKIWKVNIIDERKNKITTAINHLNNNVISVNRLHTKT